MWQNPGIRPTSDGVRCGATWCKWLQLQWVSIQWWMETGTEPSPARWCPLCSPCRRRSCCLDLRRPKAVVDWAVIRRMSSQRRSRYSLHRKDSSDKRVNSIVAQLMNYNTNRHSRWTPENPRTAKNILRWGCWWWWCSMSWSILWWVPVWWSWLLSATAALLLMMMSSQFWKQSNILHLCKLSFLDPMKI